MMQRGLHNSSIPLFMIRNQTAL